MKRIVCAMLLLALLGGCSTKPAPGATPTPLPNTTTLNSPLPSVAPGQAAIPTIPGFKEGETIDISDIPDIKAAIQDRHEGATVNSVTMMLIDGAEVYAADVTTQDNVRGMLYLLADGTFTHGPTVKVPESTPTAGDEWRLAGVMKNEQLRENFLTGILNEKVREIPYLLFTAHCSV